MSEPSQSTSVLPQLEHTTSPKKPISANTQFTDLSSRQRNASKPIKASVKAASGQPSVATLASLGIKVRDFAYESKLPPIQPIYRHPRQVQPAVVRTALKRQSTETGQDDPFSQSSSQPETSQKKLERTSTEPAIPPASETPARTLGLTNMDDFDHEYDSLQIDSQQPNMYPDFPSHSQTPPSIFESQESEPYVDTPLVTPNGSLQWPAPDTSEIPRSQLDTEPQITAPEPLSYSQLGFSLIADTSSSQRFAMPSSPLASALTLASINNGLSSQKSIISTPPRPPRGKRVASLDQRPVDPTHDAHAPTTPRVLSTRYHLRKRPVPPSSPLSPPKSSSRLHSLRSRGAVIPPSRPHCVSIQSSHSRTKPKGESSSPSSITLLRRAVTNGQEKRRRMS
ncbi:hypothetical protein BYT27DRAFT_7239775 [Phlegmacium glaucopus]|nr:hypothetical protein BYT27DRAFT_7239775 [Phlegmacium glaucopus]